LFKTKYNDYFKENVKMFDAEDFIADLTLHIPPKNVHLNNVGTKAEDGKEDHDVSLS